MELICLTVIETQNYFFVISLVTYALDCFVMVFENGVLRRIFEPKRDEVTGE